MPVYSWAETATWPEPMSFDAGESDPLIFFRRIWADDKAFLSKKWNKSPIRAPHRLQRQSPPLPSASREK